MTNLQDFLLPPVNDITQEVKPSERFKTPFTIKAITEEHNMDLKKRNTKTTWNKKLQRNEKDTDTDSYVADLVVTCVVSPDLENAKLQEHYQTSGSAIKTLRAMLTVGEFATLTEKVQEVCGFDAEDLEDLKDEVKND